MEKHRKLHRQTVLLLILLLLPALLAAKGNREEPAPLPDSPVDTAVFLETSPMGALTVLDGDPQLLPSPVLIRDMKPGLHRVEFRKEGWTTEIMEFELAPDQELLVIRKNLSRPYFSSRFRGSRNLEVNGSAVTAVDEDILMSDGTYRFGRRDDTLTVDLLYPEEERVTVTRTAFLTSLGFAGMITAFQLIRDEGEFRLSYEAGISWAVSAALGYLNFRQKAERKRFYEDTGNTAVRTVPEETSAIDYMNRAEDALTLGKLEDASREYTSVIQNYPDSSLLPEAMYNLSRIQLVNGNIPLALAGLERIKREYPVSDLYDKVCYTLATLYDRENRKEESLQNLQDMVFIDPFFDKTEIEAYIQQIQNASDSPVEETEGETP